MDEDAPDQATAGDDLIRQINVGSWICREIAIPGGSQWYVGKARKPMTGFFPCMPFEYEYPLPGSF